jgi:hypothetical protein
VAGSVDLIYLGANAGYVATTGAASRREA